MEVAISSKQFDSSAYIDMASRPVPSNSSHLVPDQHLPQQPLSVQSEPFPSIPTENFPANHSEDQKAGFRIEFPTAQINRNEYMAVEAPLEEPQNLSRKKERQHVAGDSALVGESLDQRQRADATVNELRRRIDAINRATRAAYELEPGFDQIVVLNSEQEPTMTAEEHKKMLTTLQKVVNFGRFSTVPVEDLTQILKLSEAGLKEGLSLEVQVDKDWDETSVMNWLQQASGMDTALKAARTSLRIITGGREDRQLYSESIIENSIRVFQKAADEIIMPLVELRNSGDTANVFKMLLKHKKDVSTLFVTCQKLLSMLAELVSKVQVTDLPLNTLEFVASNLVFVENAQYEKDSLAGIQKFDGIRSGAMDVLCQIFLVKPEQRQGILSEILTSLSKLPVTKQGSRQFKLADGGNIQPVSALVMRLVQSSSTSTNTDKEGRRLNMLRNIDGTDDEDELQSTRRSAVAATVISDQQAADQPDVAMQDLAAVLGPLADDALTNARVVINFLVQRAAGSSKTGETPYRNLLDLCVDDFITCMDSSDWPAAELLLRCLMSQMVFLFEGDRTPAPAKNMALETLGNLSSAISRLRSHTKRLAASVQTSETGELSAFLTELSSNLLESQGRTWQSLAWTGPFRATLESSLSRKSSDAHIESAASLTMTSWAVRVRGWFENATDEDEHRDQELGRLAYRLRMMIEDRTWLTSQFEFNTVSPAQEKLSYATILLGSPLCEAFSGMLNILLKSMTSDQATVRSKSLKSVNHVLDTDPSILDRDPSVIQRIQECASDPSTQVRESALSLLGTCMGLRPSLETSLAPTVLGRFGDAGVMVRKRAMKLARDIYLRNSEKSLRTHISAGLLRRVNMEPDETAKEAARQTVEEIWFAPFYRMDDSAGFQTAVAEHTMLIIRTAKSGGVENVLDQVFKAMLKPGATGPFSVCSKLVSNLFELINDPPTGDPDAPSGQDALQVLTIFARAEPKLFSFEQIRLLKPMIAADECKANDVALLTPFKNIMIILKNVLPQLSTVHTDFIMELRSLIQPRMGRFTFREPLDEMVECQRVICGLLQEYRPMVTLAKSCLTTVLKLGYSAQGVSVPNPKKGPSAKIIDDEKSVQRFRVYASLIGTIPRFFDLEPHSEVFKKDVQALRLQGPWQSADSVTRMFIDAFEPFVTPKQAIEVQKSALQAVAGVCQASPRAYTIPKVWALFQQVFKNRQTELQHIVLFSFKQFLTTEERRSEAKAEMGEAKSLTVMGGTSYDDVASATTQRFLKDIARVALEGQDQQALLATEVLGSINRQGLTHPKEIGVTMITLETSTNKVISEIAFREHKLLHGKHESTMEREYSKAIQSAYEYQRDVVKDNRGASVDFKEPRAKLHNMIEVLKISKMKNRQRLFEKLCALVEFDPATLDMTPEVPPHLEFTRFIVENLAFIEYQTVGELQTTVHRLENIFANIGTGVAQAIDSEVFGVRVDTNPEAQQQPQPPLPQEMEINDPIQQQLHQQINGEALEAQNSESQLSIDDERLRRLTGPAMILLIIWETRSHLRKLYSMGSSRQDAKAKAMAKDLNRSPTKAQGAQWESYWQQLETAPSMMLSRQKMLTICKHFTEVMNYDSEVKVANEEDDDIEMDPATPSDGDDDDALGGDGRGRKRKSNSTPGGRKKRQRSTSQARKRGRPRKNLEPGVGLDSDMDWA